MYVILHYGTHIVLVTLFWARGWQGGTRLVLGGTHVDRVEPTDMTTSAFLAHVGSVYRGYLRKLIKDFLVKKPKRLGSVIVGAGG